MKRPPEGWAAFRKQAAKEGRPGYTEGGNRKRTPGQAQKRAQKQAKAQPKRAAAKGQPRRVVVDESSSSDSESSSSSSSSSSSAVNAPDPAAPKRSVFSYRAAAELLRAGHSVGEVLQTTKHWQ